MYNLFLFIRILEKLGMVPFTPPKRRKLLVYYDNGRAEIVLELNASIYKDPYIVISDGLEPVQLSALYFLIPKRDVIKILFSKKRV